MTALGSFLVGLALAAAGSFWIGFADAGGLPISPGVLAIAFGAIYMDRAERS